MAKDVSDLTSLEKIESIIAKNKAIIREKKRENQELEVAATVLRRVEGVSDEKSFAGKKIRECARILLRERAPQHFRVVAKEAVKRGYTSQKGGDESAIIQSFWSVMSQDEARFEKVGTGLFQLKSSKD